MTSDHRLGIYLTALPLSEVRHLARRADERGFGSVWFPEITFADAFTPAAAVALETTRIHLATGVVGIWSRSPVSTALAAAALHQLCPGRLRLGLGLQARTYVEGWHGARYRRPVTAMREYVTIVRRILAGENVSFEGEVFRVKNFQLQIPPPPPIPIYIAAIGPRMLQLAGELADGLLGYFYSCQYIREVVLPNLKMGAERAGRSVNDLDLACGFPSIITDDDSGLELVKGQIVMFATAIGSSPFYAQSFARAGYADEVQKIQDLVARKDMKGALKLVSDDLADAFTISGTPEHARERINAYREVGVDTVVLNPSPPGIYFPLYQGHLEGIEIPPFSLPEYIKVIGQAIDSLGED